VKICKIIAEDKIEYEYLKNFLSRYPVILTQEVNLEDDIPTLIISWKTVKRIFKNHNIFDKIIDDKISWAYSKKENEKESKELIEKFINETIKKWLPQKFELIDSIFINFTLEEFIKVELKASKTYVFFDNDGLYINNGEKNYIINLKSLDLTFGDAKKEVTTFINKIKPIIVSYKNISKYVNVDDVSCLYTLENLMWVQYRQELTMSYFDLIPGFNINKYIPFIMSKVVKINLNSDELKSLKRACKRDKITEWLSTREINFRQSFDKSGLKFRYNNENKLAKIEYSNKRTLTGRIVAIDKYNPQNLPKNTDDRAQIVSRFNGGKIVTFDYTSFETRISLYLCEDEDYIEKYRKKDMHLETARIIYKKNEITIEERENAKVINHSIMYGASIITLSKKLEGLPEVENIIYNVKLFLYPLMKKTKEFSRKFAQYGYVINNWGTIIYTDKNYAAFNNIVQSTATEIIIDKISEIKEILSNYKSSFLFQVHDSLVFDIHPEERGLIKKLIKNVIKYKDMDFGINYSVGFDYKNLSAPIEIIN